MASGDFAKLQRACRTLGAALRKSRNAHSTDMAIEAPAGQRWNATETHEIVWHVNTFGRANEDYDEIASHLLQDVRDGVSACDDPACEWCNDTEDE